MGKPFSRIGNKEFPNGIEVLQQKLSELEAELNNYYNKINLIAFSPPGAQVETIPEKPDILIYVEEIETSGHLLFPGGLMNQPHIFMKEYDLCSTIKRIYENIASAK